ncbi:MAG: UvrD-helicase domain-containing protein [Pseudodesulfovibrio sp.]|nr:UvrD-helicase domain-containing protein [Pseudodesulfovibrio sp.]
MSELKQVKASAGSGKTYQLTRRFLSLLDNAEDTAQPFTCTGKPHRGYVWPEIMAVTFTNKAAAEMKERVVKGLKLSALNINDNDQKADCSPATARKALDSILRRYHRLNIRTIDSLLALLLRLFALEFGIRPDFKIAFDESEMFDAVYDHFADICNEDSPERDLLADTFTTMIRTEGRTGFWLQDMVRQRLLALARYLRSQTGPLETNQNAIRDLLISAYADFATSVKNMETLLNDRELPANANFKKFLAKCLALELFETPPDSTLIHKDSFRECILAKGKDLVDTLAESEYLQLRKAWTSYKADHAILSGAYFLAPPIEIAMRLLNGLNVLQKQRGSILGSALAGFVNELLTDGETVSEAYCRMGCRLHHLLVDEFQDTSREQWKAITPLTQECLAKGGSLFYVGDIKQAIYSWRGGDSALFDEVMTLPDVASLALETKRDILPDNWRSHKNIVEFNNTFFNNFENLVHANDLADGLFNDAPDDFRADFAFELIRNFDGCSQSIPTKHADTEGYVRMELLPGDKAAEIEENTLEALDGLMDELTARRRFRDIAVLVRTHGHAALVCDLLVQKNIPVITENSLQLDRHPIIRQLAALLAFLDYPRDDIAFLTFSGGTELFLSETGITETEFHDWLVQPKKRPLGVHFREDFPEHWQQLIEPFYNQSGLMTPYDLTQEAIRIFRVLERYPETELYVRRFLEVVHLAEENGYGSLSSFLEYWDEKSGEEKVPLPENIDAVRIMTIHKSKGLEFPVVIVPFHNWTVKPDQDFEIRQYKGHRLLTPMKKGLGKPYHSSLGRAVREQLNLLYVAWTRAREELHGFFTKKPTHSPALAAMNLFLDLDDETVFEYGQPPAEGPPAQHVSKPATIDLPPSDQSTELMAWLPRLRVYRHNLDEYFYNERMRGEVAHRAMEHVRVTGNTMADTDRAIRLAMQDFPALGALEDTELKTLEHDLHDMVTWALGNDRLLIWLANGLREPEVMDAKGKFKRFDLLYQGTETVVIDFKTGQPSPKNREQILDYMNILECIPSTQGKPKGFLVYLDLKEIHEVTSKDA